MRVFQIRQGQSSAILWTGEAISELEALDAMAHSAGYYDASDLPESIRGRGLSVEELRFGADVARIGEARMQGGRQGRVFRTGLNGHQGGQAVG